MSKLLISVALLLAPTVSNQCSDTSPGDGDASADAGAVGALCDSEHSCQPGLLCCYPCGIAPPEDDPNVCHTQCMAPMNGHCPLFP